MNKLNLTFITVITLSLLIYSCGNKKEKAGVGFETTNGVSLIVIDETESPVRGVSAKLTIASWRGKEPLQSTNYFEAQTDSNGLLLFENVPIGDYILDILRDSSLGIMLPVSVANDLDLGTQMLDTLGAIRVHSSDLRLQGLNRSPIQINSKEWIYKNLAPGHYSVFDPNESNSNLTLLPVSSWLTTWVIPSEDGFYWVHPNTRESDSLSIEAWRSSLLGNLSFALFDSIAIPCNNRWCGVRLDNIPITQATDWQAIAFADSIQIRNTQLNQIPPEISLLKRLSAFEFSWNLQNDDIDLSPLTRLPDLKKLDLDGLDIALFPEEWASAQKLTSLSIRGNQFSKIPNSIYTMGALETLHLASNPIDTLEPQSDQWQSLRTLDISNTQISDIPEEVQNLPSLIWITINGAKICNPSVEVSQWLTTRTTIGWETTQICP